MSVPTTFVVCAPGAQITVLSLPVGLTSMGTLTGKPVPQDP